MPKSITSSILTLSSPLPVLTMQTNDFRNEPILAVTQLQTNKVKKIEKS